MVTASDDGYARIWDSVPYRERFAAIQRMREAEKRMSPRVDACLKAGVSIEDVAVAIQADYALTPDEGTAALILLQRARDARKSAEQRAAQDPT